MDLNKNILEEIFVRLGVRNRFGEHGYRMDWILSVMFTCNKFYEVIKTDRIWRKFCMQFEDYDRLKFMNEEQHITWYDLYRRRLNGVWRTEEIKVGDQNNPEDYVLVQIMGNGNAYISTDWLDMFKLTHGNNMRFGDRPSMTRHVCWGPRQYIMSPISQGHTPISELYARRQQGQSVLERLKGAMPWTTANGENREIKQSIYKIKHSAFVDIASYSPFVLLLTKSGDVFEFMFLGRENNYKGDFTPHQVLFSGLDYDEKVVKIICEPIGNFAITNKQKIFAWTQFDHPVRMVKIATAAVRLNIPAPDFGWERIQSGTEYTYFYQIDTGSDTPSIPLQISNDQLFFVMVDQYLDQ